MIFAAGVTVTTGVFLVAADKTVHADTYIGITAGMCAIVTAVGLPLWRALRTAKQERAHQTEMLTRVHTGMFGRPAVVENGVTVEQKEHGLIDRVASLETQFQEGSAPLVEMKNALARNHRENSDRMDRHDERLTRVEHVAGVAATTAAAAKDRLEFLSGRWWERVAGIELRNRMLTSTLEEYGFNVGSDDDPSDDATGGDDTRDGS